MVRLFATRPDVRQPNGEPFPPEGLLVERSALGPFMPLVLLRLVRVEPYDLTIAG